MYPDSSAYFSSWPVSNILAVVPMSLYVPSNCANAVDVPKDNGNTKESASLSLLMMSSEWMMRSAEQPGRPLRENEPGLSTRHDEPQRLRNDGKQASP